MISFGKSKETPLVHESKEMLHVLKKEGSHAHKLQALSLVHQIEQYLHDLHEAMEKHHHLLEKGIELKDTSESLRKEYFEGTISKSVFHAKKKRLLTRIETANHNIIQAQRLVESFHENDILLKKYLKQLLVHCS
ncbi:MAG: hypothetical protein ACMXYK_00205 [Candidatus Woesearchaeota archaeon]